MNNNMMGVDVVKYDDDNNGIINNNIINNETNEATKDGNDLNVAFE